MSTGCKICRVFLILGTFLLILWVAYFLVFIVGGRPTRATADGVTCLGLFASLLLAYTLWHYDKICRPAPQDVGQLTWQEQARIYHSEEPWVIAKMKEEDQRKKESVDVKG